MKTEAVDSAYPFHFQIRDTARSEGGLTKRELFAAMAMQGLANGFGWCPGRIMNELELTDDAVTLADTLIERLNKVTTQYSEVEHFRKTLEDITSMDLSVSRLKSLAQSALDHIGHGYDWAEENK